MSSFSNYWRKAIQYSGALSAPRDETRFQWPRRVNGVRVEPASGVVRILPEGAQPIELSPEKTRRLASCSNNGRQHTLLAAAEEAERQHGTLVELLEGADA